MVLGQVGAQGMALVGCGSAVPAISVSNQQLSERVDTSDEWIRSRTGIGARRICGADEPLTVIATRAAEAALAHAGWAPEDLDLILMATSSPDDLFGTAPRVQGALGARNAVAFDLTAACSGFLFALITAGQYLRSGAMRRALVIGADQLSRWVDWDDRTTCVLFGDAAAAVAVEACPAEEDGLLGFRMRSDGTRNGCLTLAQTDSHHSVLEGVSAQQGGFAPLRMNGQEVYKFAVREVPAVLKELLESSGTEASQLDWLLLLDAVAAEDPHCWQRQAGLVIAYGDGSQPLAAGERLHSPGLVVQALTQDSHALGLQLGRQEWLLLPDRQALISWRQLGEHERDEHVVGILGLHPRISRGERRLRLPAHGLDPLLRLKHGQPRRLGHARVAAIPRIQPCPRRRPALGMDGRVPLLDGLERRPTGSLGPLTPLGLVEENRGAFEGVEHEDQRSEQQDEELHRDLQERVEHQPEPALAEAAAADVTLHLRLIGAEVREREEEAAGSSLGRAPFAPSLSW